MMQTHNQKQRSSNPGALFPSMRSPEKPRITLGIVPLTDSAPIVIAQEKGFFAQQGLDVTISREGSWATIRDKVTFGALDAAQMLAPMPIAATIGVSGFEKPMIAAISLGLNGNAITVSNELHGNMLEADPAAMARRPLSASPLRKLIDRGRQLTFATVFPYSSHHYLLRYWLASAGIDPDRDVRLIIIPPPQMVQTLTAGEIDGYCVGEPWNELAVRLRAGHVAITGYDIWNNAPEKVLGVTLDWAMKHPATHRALLRALLNAAQWLDEPAHREEAVRLITRPEYVSVPREMMTALRGEFRYSAEEPAAAMPDFNVFHRYAANFPWRSHAAWFVTQMMRWGQIEEAVNIRRVAEEVYRPDLLREAAGDLGIAMPLIDYKSEGSHRGYWTLGGAKDPSSIVMGPDTFCDGRFFDPAHPLDYLSRYNPCSSLIDPAALAAANG